MNIRWGIKRLLVYMMCVICILNMCGCGRGIVERIDSSGYEAEDINKDVYSLKELELELNGLRTYEASYCYCEGYMYYAAYDDSQTDIKRQTKYIYKYDVNSCTNELLFEINYDNEDEVMQWSVNSITVSSSDEITLSFIVMSKQEDMMLHSEIKKYIYSADGVCRDVKTIDCGKISFVSAKCYTDNEDNTYTVLPDYEKYELVCSKYDSAGKMCAQVSFNSYSDISYMDRSGNLIVCVNEGESQQYGYVNFDTKSLENTNSEINGVIIGEWNNILYINGMDSIMSYDPVGKEYQSLINLGLNNINGNEIDYFARVDDDKYVCVITSESSSFSTEIILMEKNEDVKEKVNIIMAAVSDNDTELVSAVNAYNRKRDDVRIEFRNYGVYSDEPYTDMLKDIMTGNSPDIFIANNMNMDTLISKNMLEDLSTYLESDETLNRDYFVDGFLDAVKIDGSQYVLMNNIVIDTLVVSEDGPKSLKDKWTTDAFIDYCGIGASDISIRYGAAPIEIFTMLLNSNMQEYIDWKTGKCGFNSDDFKRILEFCYDLEDESEDIEAGKGKTLFYNMSVCQPADLQLMDIIYDSKDSYIGYPSAGGGKSYIESRSASFAMYSMSEHKEEAWDIIKELMMGEYSRYSYGSENGIPVSAEEFDMMTRNVTITEAYTNDDGVVIEPQKILYGSDNIEIGPASDTDIAKLKELIAGSELKHTCSDIIEMIAKEASKYFNNEMGLDDTVNIIQDKVSKYVNENV